MDQEGSTNNLTARGSKNTYFAQINTYTSEPSLTLQLRSKCGITGPSRMLCGTPRTQRQSGPSCASKAFSPGHLFDPPKSEREAPMMDCYLKRLLSCLHESSFCSDGYFSGDFKRKKNIWNLACVAIINTLVPHFIYYTYIDCFYSSFSHYGAQGDIPRIPRQSFFPPGTEKTQICLASARLRDSIPSDYTLRFS